jgi:nitrogen fixation protein FixH
MSDFDQEIETGPGRPPRRWTGRMVLFCLLGFFAVVFAVNGVMIHEALSTFGGVDTASAYQAGRMFERDVAMAKAQDARQWRVDAKVTPAPDGARLDVIARDATGAPLRGVNASVAFERPTDRRLDRNVVIAEDAPGRFHGSADIAPGQWDIVIELSRQGEQLFRSKNRIVLK